MISPELTNVVEVIVKPPEIDTTAPSTKFCPVTLTSPELPREILARPEDDGEMMFGPALTVNAPASEPTPPSVFVTLTTRVPGLAADSIEILLDSSVELTTVVDSTVTPAPKDALAPLAKPVPLIATVCLLAP